MIILIDQKEYAVGLSWFAISSMQELEQFEREMELHHGVLKMTKEGNEQSTVALCGPEYNGQVSLAGMLSFAYSNLIYVMATEYKDEAGQPLFYLCAVKNHAVTVDGDMIATREVIVQMYNQNYADIMADIDPNSVNCFGVGVDDASFQGINLVEVHHVLDPALRYAAQATIKALGKKELSKTSLGLIAVLVLAGGFLVYNFFLKSPPPPPPPPKVVAAPTPPPPPQDPFKVYMGTFVNTLKTEPKISVLASVLKEVEDLPLSYDGWTVKSVSFNGPSPDTLTLNLERTPYANIDQLMQHHDKGLFASIHSDISGQQVIATLSIKPDPLTYMDADIFSSLTKASPKYFELIGRLQLNNIKFQSSEADKNNFFSAMKLGFSGEGIWSLVALYNVLLPYDTLGLKSVVITIDNGKYTWKIEGVIYG